MARPDATVSASRSLLAAIAAGGAVAGTIDIVYAIVSAGMNGRSPIWLLQAVASGLLGSEAFDGGVGAALLGLAAHFVIATGAATVFVLIARQVKAVQRGWILSGLAFGIGVYLVMNFVVLPLSAVPFRITHTVSTFAMGFLSHGLGIGLPIAAAFRLFAAVDGSKTGPDSGDSGN
ncbi:MAG: hypothetical protein IT175_13405 [Acidobacteria bacterium]|nr:hypothetical protein [Acidobacteriota bacterium]